MSDETELADEADRRHIEGKLWGLDLAHAIALRLDDGGATAERISDLMNDMRRLVKRLQRQHRVKPATIEVVLH